MNERGRTQRFFHETTPDDLKVNHTMVLSRIYRFGEKYQVAEGHELPSGIWGHAPPPQIFLFEMNMR